MNSDTEILVGEILAKSGAIEKCPICLDFMISTGDEGAEKMAYGMATNAWKAGERGFRGMEREEVISMVKTALARDPSKCPKCSRGALCKSRHPLILWGSPRRRFADVAP